MSAPRDPSPSSTLATREGTEPTLPAHGRSETGDTPDPEKKDPEAEVEVESGYEARGVVEVDDGGQKRTVQVFLEADSGRERVQHASGGPYTVPRWYVLYYLL